MFIKKPEKEEIRRYKKVEKDIFIKPKPITKISTISKRVIDEKPVKELNQKYLPTFIYFYNKEIIFLNMYNRDTKS